MEEIEVGEYIRYKSGLIRKVSRIIPIYENDKLLKDTYYIEFDDKGDIATYRKEQVIEFMIKHSPNIIDLIEVGDIIIYTKWEEVQKEEVVDVGNECVFTYKNTVYENEIKSIVTKEQMKSIEYVVKE